MNIYKAVTEEVLVPIHPAGWPFIFLFVLASILITIFWSPFALPGTLLSLWCVYFFRNPRRTTPVTDNLVIAPADGRVLSITPPLCIETDRLLAALGQVLEGLA